MRTLAVFLLGLSFFGCRSVLDRPVEDPVVRVGFGIGPSSRASGVNVLAEILYAEPLFAHDWSGRPVARLVSSWAWNAEGTRLTLHLKNNVRFHDDTLLNADVIARFLRKHAQKRRFGLRFVTAVQEPSSDSVIIELSQPDFFLLPELNEIRVTHPDSADIGTGPFRLVARSPNLEVKRFDGYHVARSRLAGVTIQTFDTQRAAWAALMRNDVDVVQEVSRDAVEFMEQSSTIETYRSLQAFTIPLLFNHRHSAFRSAEVRRAVVEAIDRGAIVERAMRGRGRVAEDPIWPFHWAYPASDGVHRPDLTSAAARLDRAGFRIPTTGKPGELRRRFAFKCLVYNEAQFERIALILQRQLFDVGIAMEIELMDLATLVEKHARSGSYDAVLLPMSSGRAMDYTYRMWHSGADEARMLNSGYKGVDQLLDELRHSWTDQDTRRIVSALKARFDEDAPAAFIAWTEVTRAVSSRFELGDSRNQDPFFNMWQWKPREITAKK